jgi:transcriptional regulator GlxA family with amidase domain
MNIETIGVLSYPSCSEQDTITALEIFKGASLVLSQQLKPLPTTQPPKKLDVKLVGLNPGNVTMQMGTVVVPEATFTDEMTFDLLYVPGGVGSGAMTLNERVLQTIRRHHGAGKLVASNCSGVGILFRAGILGQTPVTCVAAIARRLRKEGANVPQPRRMWVGNPDSRIWTTTGAYGVNGGAVALVAHYFGHQVGTTVALMFDTLGGLGQAIYETVGPQFYYYPELESAFQDFWEDRLMPTPK